MLFGSCTTSEKASLKLAESHLQEEKLRKYSYHRVKDFAYVN